MTLHIHCVKFQNTVTNLFYYVPFGRQVTDRYSLSSKTIPQYINLSWYPRPEERRVRGKDRWTIPSRPQTRDRGVLVSGRKRDDHLSKNVRSEYGQKGTNQRNVDGTILESGRFALKGR